MKRFICMMLRCWNITCFSTKMLYIITHVEKCSSSIFYMNPWNILPANSIRFYSTCWCSLQKRKYSIIRTQDMTNSGYHSIRIYFQCFFFNWFGCIDSEWWFGCYLSIIVQDSMQTISINSSSWGLNEFNWWILRLFDGFGYKLYAIQSAA